MIHLGFGGVYRGKVRTIQLLNNTVVLRNLETNPYMKAVLIFNSYTQKYTLIYEGFLAPDDTGAVEVECAYDE